MLASTLAGSVASAFPACPAPPEPASPNPGAGPITFYRDVESCRVFTYEVFYNPATGYSTGWREETAATLQFVADHGWRIAFIDRMLTGDRVQVLEYFNTTLQHYFLAIPDEWGAIDRGDAGPGWVRTGQSFTVRTPGDSPISVNVQRFYGSISPGPNSHFFTIDRQEGQALQALFYTTPADQPRWHSEGVPFNAFALPAGGACDAGRVPVWRVYNGGPARGLESNHRYGIDAELRERMVEAGWIGEGVAFCVDAAP